MASSASTVLFDFDHTVIDVDSDDHVVRGLSEAVYTAVMCGEHGARPRPAVMGEW